MNPTEVERSVWVQLTLPSFVTIGSKCIQPRWRGVCMHAELPTNIIPIRYCRT